MNNFFSANLKYLRELKGWSQSELARQTKKEYDKQLKINPSEAIKPITQGAIARWEAGENSPSIDSIVILANVLDVKLPDLIGKNLKTNSEMKQFTEEEKKEALKQVLKEKGFLNDNEEMTKEDFNKLIEFAKRNKDFIINRERN